MAGVPPPGSIPPMPSHMMQPHQPGIPPFHMGMRPPLMPVPGMMMPGAMTMPHLPSAPPLPNSMMQGDAYISAKPYTKPVSVAEMKANTTVFVGNITDKANDSLVRQILLRCGYIVGWKRVQNATGKLQAFGFCEYADPECTLRAMRLLNGFKLGDKSLVVKVDSKNKKELLKYLTKKTKLKSEENIDDDEIEKEVEQLLAKEDTNPFEQELDEEIKAEDKKILDSINTLVKENINVLSGVKSSEDVRREHDVNESLLAMAKQSGRLDEDTTLDDVDMEEDMKTLVSDEIKKFRKSYQDYEEKQAEERLKRTKERRGKEGGDQKRSPLSTRSRSRSPRVRSRSPRRRRSRSPQTRSQERKERAKEREQRKKDERERMLKEEEEYEQRQLERKKRDREKAYLKFLEQWEARERRKNKEYKYIEEEEEERREKMEREKKCLAEFLEDYDDEKDDHRFYKGSVYHHRRSERDLEIEDDNRDRKREKEELETLRLEVMERQLREIEDEKRKKKEEEEAKGGWTETGTDTHSKPKNRNEDDDEEEMVVVVKPEVDENLPLTKPGYHIGGGFVPIQVQAAPAVSAPPIKPEIKTNPNEETTTDISLVPYGPPPPLQENGDLPDSPQQSLSSKLTFELSKKSSKSSRVSIEGVFGTEEEKEEAKPKKKLYTLTSSSKGSQFTAAMAEMPHGGAVTADDRKKLIQSLVNSIPSKREELFHWDLRWNQIDQNLMEKRVAPWINKKIVEYIGEPEPTLTDFICNKLAEHVSAEDILKDIAMVLDDEAEVFVLKLWRLLIYETEARHLGIAKNY